MSAQVASPAAKGSGRGSPADPVRAPIGTHAWGMWKPRRGPAVTAGRPTVREAEARGGTGWPKKLMPVAERQQETGTTWLAPSLAIPDNAATLLSWLGLIALDGGLARAEPKTLRCRLLYTAGKLVRGGRRGPAESPCNLALGKCHSHRLGPDHRPATPTLTSSKPTRDHGRSNPGARGTAGRRPASRATVIPGP